MTKAETDIEDQIRAKISELELLIDNLRKHSPINVEAKDELATGIDRLATDLWEISDKSQTAEYWEEGKYTGQ